MGLFNYGMLGRKTASYSLVFECIRAGNNSTESGGEVSASDGSCCALGCSSSSSWGRCLFGAPQILRFNSQCHGGCIPKAAKTSQILAILPSHPLFSFLHAHQIWSQSIPTHSPLQFNSSALEGMCIEHVKLECMCIEHAQKQWLKLHWLNASEFITKAINHLQLYVVNGTNKFSYLFLRQKANKPMPRMKHEGTCLISWIWKADNLISHICWGGNS